MFLFFSCLSLCWYMLIFQIKRIISSEKWFNYVVALFFVLFCFLFQNAKNLGRSETLKEEKKRGWPYNEFVKRLL